ncbi:hypothetical protein [Roseivirga misakiensis]|nr:hypothetical protein [Roseivirga misakiensis]
MNAETTCIDCCEAIELDRNKTEWMHLSRLLELLFRIKIVGAEDMSKIK